MAISDTITSMYENVGNVYDVLELAGADLTNIDKNIFNLKQTWEERLLYFLANGTDVVWNNWNKITGSGTTLSLNNTIEAKMDFVYKGNTYQESTTGKNLLQRATGKTKNGITFTILDDNSVKVSGTATANVSLNFSTNATGDAINIPAGTYVLSGCPSGGSSSTYKLATNIADITSNDYGSGVTITANTEQTSKALWITIYSGTTCNNLIFKPMLRLSNTTDDYEPYTGGIASPNPDYPQDIQVVTGDNTIKIQSKNIFDGEFRQGSWNNTTSTDRIFSKNQLFLKRGTTCTFETDLDLTTYNFGILVNDSSFPVNSLNTSIDSGWLSTNTYTFTTTRDGYFGLNIKKIDGSNINVSNVENSNFVLYNNSQTYNITLGNLELCKIGDYQDYIYKDSGKWYLHKEIGKVVLDGSENWDSRAFPDNSYLSVKMTLQPKENGGLCNYFISDNRYDIVNEHMTISKQWNELCFAILKSRLSTQTTAGFKNWLSTNQPIVYYVLATPTYEEITDTTLISQLEAIKKSYNTQTNISQENNDLPFELDVVALGKLS